MNYHNSGYDRNEREFINRTDVPIRRNLSETSAGGRKSGSRHASHYRVKNGSGPVISGYFIKEKSYKEIIISRINTALCCILGFLVSVCLVSYYFVVVNEIELRELSKETIALTYDNADMQNKLDNLQSFSNVDLQVSKNNTLQRAKQVMELSAADLPNVEFDKYGDDVMNKYLGY